jgi:hypothetical protein
VKLSGNKAEIITGMAIRIAKEFSFLPGRTLNAPYRNRLRYDGPDGGGTTGRVKVGPETVSLRFTPEQVTETLLRDKGAASAAQYLAELVVKCPSLTPEQIDAYRARSFQLAQESARSSFDQGQYEQTIRSCRLAAETGPADQNNNTLVILQAEALTALAEQQAKAAETKTDAKVSYQTALDLWQALANKLKVRDCQVKLAELSVRDEAVALYRTAATLTLECGLGRQEAEGLIRRAIAIVPIERHLAIWNSYEQTAAALAPAETKTVPPPEIEAIQQKRVIAQSVKAARDDAAPLSSRGEHYKAFLHLKKEAIRLIQTYGAVIDGDKHIKILIAELWQACGMQGRATLEDRKVSRMVSKEEVIAAFRQAQELFRSAGQSSAAYDLNDNITYIREKPFGRD